MRGSETQKNRRRKRPSAATGSCVQKNSEAGNDLLSREANRSTIGAGGLNFRVRHGTGWTPSAILTCFTVSIKTGKAHYSLLHLVCSACIFLTLQPLAQHETKTG